MSEWSRFTLKGWTFIAMMPNGDDPQAWSVLIDDPNGERHTLTVPMGYAPIFGPDVSDVDAMNAAVEAFITERGIE